MTSNKGKKRKWFQKKMLSKYRVVMINEETLEERASLRLNRLNIFVYGSLLAFTMIFLTTLVIIYSPLRQYILGFSEAELRGKIVEIAFKTDSLETALNQNKHFFSAIQKALKGDIKPEKINKNDVHSDEETFNIDDLDLEPSEEELKLRQDVADEEKFSIFDPATSNRKKVIFFSPLSGNIIQSFAPEKKIFGIQIASKEDTPVKSIADGTIIFAEWTAQSGFVSIVKHADNYVSVYKQNGTLTKKEGDFVKAGEVIASVGKAQTMKTAYLQFELWNNGYPVNPFNFLNFK